MTFLFVGWKSTPKENLTGSKKIISSPSKQITPEPYSKFININEASLEELDTLIGIGLVTAQKIIDNRTYESINDLLDKKVISKTVFEKIKSKIII